VVDLSHAPLELTCLREMFGTFASQLSSIFLDLHSTMYEQFFEIVNIIEWYDSIRLIFQNSLKYHFDFEIVHSNHQSIYKKKIMRKKTKERENPFREWLIFCNRRNINTSFLSLSFSVKKIELVGTRINEMYFVFWWRW